MLVDTECTFMGARTGSDPEMCITGCVLRVSVQIAGSVE